MPVGTYLGHYGTYLRIYNIAGKHLRHSANFLSEFHQLLLLRKFFSLAFMITQHNYTAILMKLNFVKYKYLAIEKSFSVKYICAMIFKSNVFLAISCTLASSHHRPHMFRSWRAQLH